VTKLALIPIEGPDKATRPVGGEGEWEAIKISRTNLAYVLKKIQRAFLLTLLRSHSYRKAIGPQNRVRKPQITTETQFGASKSLKRYHSNPKIDQQACHWLTHISSDTSCARPTNQHNSTIGTRKTRALELSTQERDQLPQETTKNRGKLFLDDFSQRLEKKITSKKNELSPLVTSSKSKPCSSNRDPVGAQVPRRIGERPGM
jgi:hypothetical protein